MNQNNLVNIRAIRNKKAIKQVKLKAKNTHEQYYGESEDSDDERILSKIGRLQTKKYQDKDFIGYDENLNKIEKKKHFKDTIEEFLNKSENKDWWRVVRDELNNQDVVLSDKQLELLDRIRTHKTAQSLAGNDYYFEHEDFDQFNLLSSYMPKRRFLPSKWERIKINKLVQGIKLGRIQLNPPPTDVKGINDIWEQEQQEQQEQISKYLPPRIPAAKQALPTTVASYNPPNEYLFTPQEKEEWLQQDAEGRELPFMPQKYKYLRNVPSSELLTREIFDRCLDLYLAPRIRRKKLMMKSSDFLPEIPKPEEMKPFPTHLNTEFGQIDVEKAGRAKMLSIRNDGQMLAVCYERAIALFDCKSTKCLYVEWMDEEECDFNGIEFSEQGLLGIIRNNKIIILNSHLDKREIDNVEEGRLIKVQQQQQQVCEWNFDKDTQSLFQREIQIKIQSNPMFINFHNKGDYFVTTQPYDYTKSNSILVHCISKAQSSQPFQNMKAKTEVQQTVFHPTQPQLFIMTNKNVFIYSLNQQQLVKKLLSGNQQNSTIAIHPYGENILVGSNDFKVCWFDLEMGKTPFKKMSYHHQSVNRVAFHKRYPLFASCADDGTINIFHCKVSLNDYSAPIILPLKVLKAKKKLAVKDVVFHPTQAWIYSISLDGNVNMWT